MKLNNGFSLIFAGGGKTNYRSAASQWGHTQSGIEMYSKSLRAIFVIQLYKVH